jgi:hypothetical protein
MSSRNIALEAIDYRDYPDLAIDRGQQLQRLKRNIETGVNTAVIGPFESGKSSLCFTAMEVLSDHLPYIRVSMADCTDPRYFVPSFETMLKSKGMSIFPRVVCLEEMQPLNRAGNSMPIVDYIRRHSRAVWILVGQELLNRQLASVCRDIIRLDYIPENLRPEMKLRIKR